MLPVQRFTELVAADDVDLLEATLCIAAAGQPPVDARWCRGELERLAEGVSSVHALRRRLSRDAGFRGNRRAYSDPANSFIHRVLQRRLGIPITLSLVTIEVGRRAGIPLEPIGMPGHFLVRDPGSGAYLDAFAGMDVLDRDGCEARFRAATGAPEDVPFTDHYLRPVTNVELLGRMLANLRSVYLRHARNQDLEWVLRMRVALPGAGPDDALELAEAVAAQGRLHQAGTILVRAAGRHPAAADRLEAEARRLLARLN
jgi:regulator of sirC expression with transglutaminase-like and TPR domain